MTTRKRKGDLLKVENDVVTPEVKKVPAEPTGIEEIHCSNPVNRSHDKITGTVTLRVPITTPNDNKWIRSSNVIIGGFDWKICAQVNINNDLCPQIQCNTSNRSKLWICKATCEFGILNNDRTISYNYTCNGIFNRNSCTMGSTKRRWDHLNTDSKFIKDGNITIQVVVTIDNHAGLRKFTPFDFSRPTRHSDVILLVGEDRFHVNKTMLAVQSTFFDSLFFSDFAEKDKEEVKLIDIDSKKFEEFLHFVYHSGYSVTDDNYESLLELADMFQVTTLIEACEDFLSMTPRCTNLKNLRLADKYALPKVLVACTETFKDTATVKTFTKQKEFADLSLYTQLEIFKKINQFYN